MSTDTLTRACSDDHIVVAHEIRWTLVAVTPIEDRWQVPSILVWEDLALYTHDLQVELRAVRTLLHDTLGALHLTAAQRDRAVALVQLQRRQRRMAMRAA